MVVARYDRFLTQGQDVVRIHQEDFCQALGERQARNVPVTAGAEEVWMQGHLRDGHWVSGHYRRAPQPRRGASGFSRFAP